MNKGMENAAAQDKEVWNKMLNTLFQQCREALLLIDYQGVVQIANASAMDLFGYCLNEIQNLRIESLLQAVNEPELKVTIPDLLHMYDKNIQVVRKDNHLLPVSIRMSNISTSRSVYVLLFISALENRLIKDKTLQRKNAEIIKLKELNNRLKNYSERVLRDRTQILQETVDSLVETQNQLRQSLSKEIAANEKCSKFAYLISHEYRNPLTAILSSLNLIERHGHAGNPLSDAQSQHLVKAREYIKLLVSVTDELLQLNTTLNGGRKLSTAEVVVTDLLTELSQNWSRIFGEKQTVPIRLNAPGKVVVETNSDLLKQALNNLLSNAVKYSDGHGEVVIECEEVEDCCVIKIKDQGRGIPKEEIQKLSNGFYRASNTNGVSGNGLGLFIVRQFLEHLNGKLELVSELDFGTCATIRLPKRYEEKSIAD
jgi:signal transduction histidine kinase